MDVVRGSRSNLGYKNEQSKEIKFSYCRSTHISNTHLKEFNVNLWNLPCTRCIDFSKQKKIAAEQLNQLKEQCIEDKVDALKLIGIAPHRKFCSENLHREQVV